MPKLFFEKFLVGFERCRGPGPIDDPKTAKDHVCGQPLGQHAPTTFLADKPWKVGKIECFVSESYFCALSKQSLSKRSRRRQEYPKT
jgi:hypothetical protein